MRQNADPLSAAECRSVEAAYELQVMEAEMAGPNRKHAPAIYCIALKQEQLVKQEWVGGSKFCGHEGKS